MKSVRSWCVIAILILVSGGSVFAEVGLGLTVSDDFPDVPEAEEIYSRLIASDNITPGILVFFTERDWGMSFDFGFDITADVPDPMPGDPGWLDFSFAATYDWHPLRLRVFDPFVQLGAGIDMAAPVTETADTVRLRFHPVLGAGLNLRFGQVFARAAVQYQGFSVGVPVPDISPYEAGPYRVMLSAGFLFR